MPPDNDLDDLFRQQLGPHATPPGDDLQRRLAELAAAERLDARFRAGLGGHASQPRRALWERLEDEHLRPPVRRRRAAAWWRLSAAAVLLLLLLAGGAGLWRGYLGPLASRGVAAGKPEPQRSGRATAPALGGTIGAAASPKSIAQPADEQNFAAQSTTIPKKNQLKNAPQATAPALSPSSPPIATATRPRRTAAAHRAAGSQQTHSRPPDAAAGELAITRQRKAPAGQPEPATGQPTVAAATPTLAAAPAPMGLVEVEVRRGPETARPAPTPTVAAEGPPARRPRLRLGGLLRQAGHLAHGEPVSLAEATDPAESLTVRARIGGRLLSKTIQL